MQSTVPPAAAAAPTLRTVIETVTVVPGRGTVGVNVMSPGMIWRSGFPASRAENPVLNPVGVWSPFTRSAEALTLTSRVAETAALPAEARQSSVWAPAVGFQWGNDARTASLPAAMSAA